jgi:hypothetical protein
MHNRQPPHRHVIGIVAFATLLACEVASAARTDGRIWWDEKRAAYPQCNALTNEHERLTDELDRIGETARYAREPQRADIFRRLNTTAATRNRVQDQLFACIRASGQPTQTPVDASDPARPPLLKGGVEQTDRGSPGSPQLPPAGQPGTPPGAGGTAVTPPGGTWLPPGSGGTTVTPPGRQWTPPAGGGNPGRLPNGTPGGTPGGSGGNPPQSAPIDDTPPGQPRPVRPAADPQAYVQGFLEGFASCLGSALIGPIQQIWTDAGIYARFGTALLQGDSASAASILQIKGERDRRTFDAFVRSLNPNVFGVRARDAGRRDGSRLCSFGVIPGIVRAGNGLPGARPAVRPPAGAAATGVRALLADLSWLRQFNASRCRTNCSNSALTVDQTLAGKPGHPVPPGPALTPATIESFYGSKFGPRMLSEFVELTMRNRGDLKRAIIRGDAGPDTPGHQFNVINDGGRVRLLDGQLGREITWAELAQNGITEFQLLFTN